MIEHIDAALEPYSDRQWHTSDWQNMVALALRHMVHTPRDAKRVANAVPGAITVYGEEVALVDLLGLEALRVLEPDVHAGLPAVANILIGGQLLLDNDQAQRDRDREAIERLSKRRVAPMALAPYWVNCSLRPIQPSPGFVLAGTNRRNVERTVSRLLRSFARTFT